MKKKAYYLFCSVLLTGLFLLSTTSCNKNDEKINPKPTPETPNPEPTTVKDIDGNVYNIVKIGDQVWMAENLKVSHYRNGDKIKDESGKVWNVLTSGSCCEYNNSQTNLKTYGMIYNWYALVDSRNIAPVGWHVPSKAEWEKLIAYLGGATYAGQKMKETGTTHWSSPNQFATNESGFTGLPGGYRASCCGFFRKDNFCMWWSTTVNSQYNYNVCTISLRSESPFATINDENKKCGLYVRCIKD